MLPSKLFCQCQESTQMLKHRAPKSANGCLGTNLIGCEEVIVL